MTIRLALSMLMLVVATACVTGLSARRGGLSEEEVAEFPPDVADAYRLFAQKCSRCHTLARPLSAGIDDDAHWERYVGRMRRQAGSGISPADAKEILKFLRYYTAQQAARDAAEEAEEATEAYEEDEP